MKKISITFLLLTLTLSGCDVLDKAKLDAENFTNTAKSSISEATQNVIKTKEQIENTYNDIKDAAKKIEEAKQAVDKVTGS